MNGNANGNPPPPLALETPPMDDELLKIYALMKLAEDHLRDLKHATAELRAGHDALTEDRRALKKTAAEQTGNLLAAALNLKTVGAGIRQEAQNATPALQDATRKAVEASIARLLPQVATQAAEGLKTASESILERLAGVTAAAQAAEAALKNAGRWFAWKWAALAAGGLGGALALAFLTFQALEWSHRHALTTEHQGLLQDIAQQRNRLTQLQDAADALEKRTHGLRVVSGSDGVFLIAPKGTPTTQCRAGPCMRLQDTAR